MTEGSATASSPPGEQTGMSKPDTTPGRRDAGGTNWDEFDALTDEQIAAGVARDPDASLSTPEQLARMMRISPARHIRQKLRLAPWKFAELYDIPLETLQAWERHEAEPSLVELAYLRLIERNPELARKVPA